MDYALYVFLKLVEQLAAPICSLKAAKLEFDLFQGEPVKPLVQESFRV